MSSIWDVDGDEKKNVSSNTDKIKDLLGIEDKPIEYSIDGERDKAIQEAKELQEGDAGGDLSDILDAISGIGGESAPGSHLESLKEQIEVSKKIASSGKLSRSAARSITKSIVKSVRNALDSGEISKEDLSEAFESEDAMDGLGDMFDQAMEADAQEEAAGASEGEETSAPTTPTDPSEGGEEGEEKEYDIGKGVAKIREETESKPTVGISKKPKSAVIPKKPKSSTEKAFEAVEPDSETGLNQYNSYARAKEVRYETISEFASSVPATPREFKGTDRYNEAEPIARNLVKEIRKLKAHNVEEKETALAKGKKICRRNIARVDRKIFERKVVSESEEADLSVYVALDHSGSVGHQLAHDISVAGLAITQALERLHIQHHVVYYSHEIVPVTAGKKRSTGKWQMAGKTRGTGGNNEHAVMLHVAAQAEKDRHKHKMLFIITDGMGSGEDAGLEEIASVDKDMKVFAVGIVYNGGTFVEEQAKETYGKNRAIAVKSKDDMAKALTNLIKKEVLQHE